MKKLQHFLNPLRAQKYFVKLPGSFPLFLYCHETSERTIHNWPVRITKCEVLYTEAGKYCEAKTTHKHKNPSKFSSKSTQSFLNNAYITITTRKYSSLGWKKLILTKMSRQAYPYIPTPFLLCKINEKYVLVFAVAGLHTWSATHLRHTEKISVFEICWSHCVISW